jgi:GNAT superfamily N-acetyltransferase
MTLMSRMIYIPCSGSELAPHVDALGGLRIAVFREFPYLYDGALNNEREYLQTYVNCSRSLVVLAYDGDRAVGATTCMPMAEEGQEFQAAFVQAGYDLSEICYFGESILLPEYRGRGVGKEFMKRRLAHAEGLPGVKFCAFCAVDRPLDHPMRPASYKPLDGFWQAQGFVKHPELHTTFTWKEIGEEAESPKRLTFWLREL